MVFSGWVNKDTGKPVEILADYAHRIYFIPRSYQPTPIIGIDITAETTNDSWAYHFADWLIPDKVALYRCAEGGPDPDHQFTIDGKGKYHFNGELYESN